MCRTASLALVTLVICAIGCSATAQVVNQVVYYPTTPVVYPAVPVAPQPVVVQRPVILQQPTVVYRPVTPYVAARPVVAAPAVAAPAPMVATPVTVTRNRPILGGTVTRTYYRYQPAPIVAAPIAVPAY